MLRIIKYIPTLCAIRSRASRLKGSMSSTTTKDQAAAVTMSALAIAALQQGVTIDDSVASAAVTVLVWIIGSFVGPAVMRMVKYVEKKTPVTHEATPATEDPIRERVKADALRKAQDAIAAANKTPDLVMVQFRGGAPVWLRDPIPWADAMSAGYDLGRDARGVIHELWKEREALERHKEGV